MSLRRAATLSLICALGLASLPVAQSRLSTTSAPTASFTAFAHGRAVVLLDDVDGDGLREPAVLSVGVRVYSSATGRVLRHYVGGPGVTTAATALAVLDDLDGDSVSDLAIGYAFESPGGVVEVVSARTGRRLFAVAASGTGWQFGSSLAAVGDVNLDGVPDLAIGAPERSTTGPGGGTSVGLVRIVSGVDGATLWNASFGGPGSRCGASLAALGDLDGDGRPSLAISSPGVRNVYVAEPLGSPALVTLTVSASSAPDSFGHAIASVGDLDGDGRRDMAVGAPTWQETPCSPFDPFCNRPEKLGRVHAFGSVSGALLWTKEGVGVLDNERFGWDVGDAGDCNLDGVPDVIVGAHGVMLPSEAGSSGDLRVLSGASGSSIAFPLFGSPGGDRAFALAEDADGNGQADLWVGRGRLLRRQGSAGDFQPTLETADFDGFGFGSAVAVLDDLDGDGLAETAIGAPHWPGEGAAAGPGSRGAIDVMSQGVLLQRLNGLEGNEEFGTAIAALDDLDGDGIDDFAVGRPNAVFGVGTRTGAVTVFSGATRSVIRSHFGQSFGDRFGAALARVPDTDGDGVDDYVVGAPHWSSAGGLLEVGRVQWFSGATGVQLFLRNGAVSTGRFGASVAGVPDVDGDGHGDVLVGAPREWTVLSNLFAGRVRCWSGANGNELWSVVGSQAGMNLGSSVAAVGDLTGDGVGDVIAGAPRFGVAQVGDGRVELRSGVDGSLVWSDGGAFESGLGTAVLAPGDLDNDGVPDFLVGEPRGVDAVAVERPGYARLYSGAGPTLVTAFRGASNGSRFGSALATGADLDGDRADDVLIGAPVPTSSLLAYADLWTARSIGSEPTGFGTAGCAGPVDLTLARPARIGQSMELRFGEFTAGAVPVLFAGDSPSAVGVPLLSARLHLNALILLELPALTSDYGVFVVPLPNDPALVGGELSLQVFTFWPFLCPELSFPLSSTNALTVTFQ